jgi:hypothetical protein
MGLDEEECDSPECAMDDAVAQLEEAGYVVARTTEDLLMDGHRGYEIALTEEGKTFLASRVALLLRPTENHWQLKSLAMCRPVPVLWSQKNLFR